MFVLAFVVGSRGTTSLGIKQLLVCLNISLMLDLGVDYMEL